MQIAGYRTAIEMLYIGDREFSLALPTDIDSVLQHEADPYWCEVWDASIVLAEFLVERREWTDGDLIEIGCGVGLAGIVAATLGTQVRLTDYNHTALAFAEHNCALNSCKNTEVAYLDWHDPQIDRRFDGILAADVIYDPMNWEALLDFWPKLLKADGWILLAEPGRLHASDFLKLAVEHGLYWETSYRQPRRIKSARRVGIYQMRYINGASRACTSADTALSLTEASQTVGSKREPIGVSTTARS